MRIALTTYSVKPRGGVVHTLELAEALQRAGADVTVVAMGDPEAGFFRPVDVPVHIVQAPAWGDTLEKRVFRWIDAMTKGISSMASDFDIIHSQDCISARAAARVRDDNTIDSNFRLVRTVHHVDDFTTQALIDCQRNAIIEPDQVLVVSELWKRQLLDDYDVEATVVNNGVRAERFAAPIAADRHAELRAQSESENRFLYLTVGGIEPRKGSEHLIDALSMRKSQSEPGTSPVLAIIGGHSFQDYADYRERVLKTIANGNLVLGEDVVLLGTVSEQELPEWFQAADGFVFPSVNEGWGLVVLEAMAAGLAVVTSDIDVFHEFIVDDKHALMSRTGDAADLASKMLRLESEPQLRRRLIAEGLGVAERYSWATTADQHLGAYGAELTH